ncbi:A24 family peptidase [Streptomyces sp. NPDC005953]|uniref:prepilin peptidase n=1 Tax=Streptomyces sp. NPDC005953 TaxID=3156719 RepID=UPI0033DFC496
MYATLIAASVLWGLATGLLIPRAAYRLAVPATDPWRDECPAGHPFRGPLGGWLGPARCSDCVGAKGGSLLPGPGDGSYGNSGTGGRTASDARSAAADATPANATPSDPPPVLRADPASGRKPTADGGGPWRSVSVRIAPGVVPLLTAAVCAVLAVATGCRPELAVWLVLTPVATLLAVVDARVHRLPDHLTLPLAAAAVVLLGLASVLPSDGGSWTTALLGGLTLGAFYCLLFVIHPGGMGFGDVKLALSLGVVLGWYGWGVLITGAFAGFLFGSLYGFGLIALGRAHRKSAIPFGPFMILGALFGVVWGGFAALR